MRGDAGTGQALRDAEPRRQGRRRQGAVQGDPRAAPGAARRGRRARHRPRHRPRWPVQVLPRHHAVREGSESVGGELRADAQVAAPLADRQRHLRADDAADGYRPVRQQDIVRAGERAAARAEGDVGRMGGGDAAGRESDAGPLRDGLRPQRPSLRRHRDQPGCEALRCQGQPRHRRRLQGDGEEVLRLESRRHDAEGGLGRRRWLDLPRCVRGVRQRPRRAVSVGKLANQADGAADRQELRLDRRSESVRPGRRVRECRAAPRSWP